MKINISFVKKIIIGMLALVLILDLIIGIVILNRLINMQYDINGIEWDVSQNVETLNDLNDTVTDMKWDINSIKSDVSDIEYYLR